MPIWNEEYLKQVWLVFFLVESGFYRPWQSNKHQPGCNRFLWALDSTGNLRKTFLFLLTLPSPTAQIPHKKREFLKSCFQSRLWIHLYLWHHRTLCVSPYILLQCIKIQIIWERRSSEQLSFLLSSMSIYKCHYMHCNMKKLQQSLHPVLHTHSCVGIYFIIDSLLILVLILFEHLFIIIFKNEIRKSIS